jgi:hypothetical protein
LSGVVTVARVGQGSLVALLARYGLELVVQAPGEPISGSFWGDPEAGVIGTTVYVRPDTPIHSLLHEAGHVICMDGERRARLERDAGGDALEESAVCYLQVLLADALAAVGRGRLMADMDAWGYSFRLGSTRAWFEQDADDAREFLVEHGLIDERVRPTWRLRP